MIYLDYNATTPIAPEVAEAMLPYLYGHYGNPSSTHSLGVTAKKAIEKAREQVAGLINGSVREIVFTSGGSEANNTVIKGVAWMLRDQGRHMITVQTEHPTVLRPCQHLEQQGYRVTYLPVDRYGMVSPAQLEAAITTETILISIMHANNETGTLQPIADLAAVARKHGIHFHSDAAQSAGKVPVDVESLGVDFLTLVGHKIYAPKGIGALYIREGSHLEPLLHGGGQEGGRRAGTESALLDAGLGQACHLAQQEQDHNRIRDLTDYFWHGLQHYCGERIQLNGHPTHRLPNTLNVSFLGFNAHDILPLLDDIAASTGSACHSGLTSISPVLNAMGATEEAGRGAVRFSLGRYSTEDEIETVLQRLKTIISA